MSESSQLESSSVPVPLEFERKAFPNYEVDYAASGNDIIYHFWPAQEDFPNNFAILLEKAFSSILPDDADVRAAYTSKEEAEIISKFGDNDAPTTPTYYVRVVGWAENPMVDKFLKDKVFSRLDTFISEDINSSSV